jgi:phytoene dehydrogenase-like protein
MIESFEISLREATHRRWDVVVVGAGHNGLVAALCLSRAGLDVLLVEALSAVGGAAKTERPFPKAPDLPVSTGAYLLGLIQPELLDRLGLELPLIRRDPHYFLPTTDGRHLLFGSDEARLARDFERFFSKRDYQAHLALSRELAALRDDIAPSWLEEPLSIEDTAAHFVRPELAETFVRLCRGSVGDYLARFEFQSPLLEAMYAVTDGFTGCHGEWDTPGTGMNFLIHNMCRLKGSGGTWMLVRGGMGTVSETIAAAVAESGGRLLTGARVARLECGGGSARALALESGEVIEAGVIVANCDPFRLRELTGPDRFTPDFNRWLDVRKRPGSTLKINLALSGLPKFTCLPEDRGQFGPTTHLLPDEGSVRAELAAAFAAARSGQLPEFPSIELYMQTPLDPSSSDSQGHISAALFVQWVPQTLTTSTWDAEAERYADHLTSLCDRFAPGTSQLVVDRMILHPERLERHFGLSFGHIHHLDNCYGFADRFPHKTPIDGLYSCSAGTHPGGSVIGSAGYIAARRVLADLGRPTPS